MAGLDQIFCFKEIVKFLSWLLVLCGVLGLIGVRFMETRLFYDPFLEYFHLADEQYPVPRFDLLKLIGSHIFRFLLNLFFSLVVVHFLFRNRRWTVQAAALITIVFMVTFPIYLACIYTDFKIGYLFSFFVRRFVIQPLILLLIVPMFYYRKHLDKS